MKNLMLILVTSFLMITTAQADQFRVHVTGANKEVIQQAQLAHLVNRTLVIDTEAQAVHINITPECPSDEFCAQMLTTLTFKIKYIEMINQHVATITAEGYTTVKEETLPTQMTLTVDESNQSTIEFTSVKTGLERAFRHYHATFTGTLPLVTPVIF